MVQYDVRVQKAEMLWKPAQKHYDYAGGGLPFMCINLAMYAIGHYVEALLARLHRHPSGPRRGVPRGDAPEASSSPGHRRRELGRSTTWGLTASRHTFIDGGLPNRRAAAEYMALATSTGHLPQDTPVRIRIHNPEGMANGK